MWPTDVLRAACACRLFCEFIWLIVSNHSGRHPLMAGACMDQFPIPFLFPHFLFPHRNTPFPVVFSLRVRLAPPPLL
jgi:hypothetical protein